MGFRGTIKGGNGMPDKFSKETRSYIMSQIKSTGSKMERDVMGNLEKRKVPFTANDKTLFGKPDIAVEKWKAVIFLDSCYWHCCPIHYKRPQSNQAYWDKKCKNNTRRDKEVNAYYRKAGWNILRIWEHELKEDRTAAINRIVRFLREARKQYKEGKG
jgi:DNA mismatch endonuclease, patch repair protein